MKRSLHGSERSRRGALWNVPVGVVFTCSLTYIALWIAFVTTGDDAGASDGFPSLLSAVAVTPILIGVLYGTGSYIASVRRTSGWNGYRQRVGTGAAAVVALIVVATELGLVVALRSLLWGGPAWLRWSVVGLAVVTMVLGSGRAWGWAVIVGLLWSALGAWAGAGWDLVGRVDLLLTGAMVGTTLGAVIGTLFKSRRREIGSGW